MMVPQTERWQQRMETGHGFRRLNEKAGFDGGVGVGGVGGGEEKIKRKIPRVSVRAVEIGDIFW